ncbi:tumor necrosis factor receptor superfamily member 16 [Trichomycterus rosablanca]|uniref:tumor necrosis factor receptor superfamily member 16 n=1 Tax=Trichomycterus rosablanca TaxID=2290929 RepID=UPI002F34F1A4
MFLKANIVYQKGKHQVAVMCGSAVEVDDECSSGQYTSSGECCIECPPGEGVITACGATQTVCGQCLDSETYSANYSHTETCQPCTECEGLMRIKTPCTDSNNAECVCDYGFYKNLVSGQCEPCTVCLRGEGVFMSCEHYHDTVCEQCVDATYSDQESSLDPCLPCTFCDEGEVETRGCSPSADAICFDPNAPTMATTTFLPESSSEDPRESRSPGPDEDSATTKPSSTHFIGNGINENLIPIYCSTLAAVLVGLLAYIVFKRWNSCKQNKQAANNRAATANQTSPSPEGEKLHSDSGISVDSQSLQEQQQQQMCESHTCPQTQLHVPEQIDQ